MRGLRTQENTKFKNFFSSVQQKALENKKVFFLDSGQGNEFSTDTIEGEDLCGWLIPEKVASVFEEKWKAFNALDEWEDYFVYVDVSYIDGVLKIQFN